ncbi:S1 family peptidase, partial [Paenibacillus sp. TAF58]
ENQKDASLIYPSQPAAAESASAASSVASPEKDRENDQLIAAKKVLGDFDSVGSFYIDKSGHFNIAVSKDSENVNSILEKIKNIIPSEKLKIVKGRKYSSKELFNINKELSNISEYNSEDTKITQTYMDEELGKVVIEAASMSDATKNKLLGLYKDAVDIRINSTFQGTEKTFTRTDNFGVLGGGIAINNSSCTMAATATKGTDRFIVTVGHCLTGNGTSTVYQNSTSVGVDWAKAVSHDIGLIKVTGSGRWISNKILRTSPNTAYDGKYTTTSTATQGQTLCKAGITTNETCFKVLSTSVNTSNYQDAIKVENPYWQNQNNGDSGAPMYSTSNVLYGIMSEKDTAYGSSSAAYATKISYFGYYWPDYSLYTSDINY